MISVCPLDLLCRRRLLTVRSTRLIDPNPLGGILWLVDSLQLYIS